MSPERNLNVALLLFDDVEELDFVGPFEVFAVAARPEIAGPDAPFALHVFTVAQHTGTVRARGGLRVQPDFDFASCPPVDLLVVPGGMGTRREAYNTDLIRWIRDTHQNTLLTTSVCTGAFLLGEAGLLHGLEATTHWASVDRLRETFPATTVRDDLRLVDTGRVATSAGISAGIDMAFHIVSRLLGDETARRTARQMEYSWSQPT